MEKKKTLGVSFLRGGWGLPYLFCTMCICSFYICSCLHTCRCRLKDREHEDKRGKKAELPHPRRPHPRCPPAAAARSPPPARRQPLRDAAAPAGLTGGTRAVLGVHAAAARRQSWGWSFTLPVPPPPLFIHGGREECKTSSPRSQPAHGSARCRPGRC